MNDASRSPQAPGVPGRAFPRTRAPLTRRIRRLAVGLHRGEAAQDGFEYLLATAVVVIALFVGLLAFAEMIPDFVGNSCDSVNTASATPNDCVNETP